MTALDVITRALRMAGILAAAETARYETANDGLLSLNGLMHGYELKGVRLGHVTLALADTIPLPDSHIEMLTLVLAPILSAEHGVALRPAIEARAAEADAALRAVYVQVPLMVADPAYQRTTAVEEQPAW